MANLARHLPIISIAFILSFPVAAADNFTNVDLAGPSEINVQLGNTNQDLEQRRRYYQTKIDRIRTHHLAVPLQESQVPFSTTKSPNKQKVVAPKEIALSESVLIEKKPSVTELAKMQYRYVSPVAEPSSAVRGKNVLVTFNWGAAWSDDGGLTFSQLDPIALFDNPKAEVGAGFCCDQVAIYSPKHDLMIWLLQGSHNDKGNTIRLLFAKGDDISARKWRVHDFSPGSIGKWEGEWFDYPDIAVNDNHLFISLNSFTIEGSDFRRSAVLRFPLAQLASYAPVKVGAFSSDAQEDFSPRFSQGSQGRMYWAAHRNTATIVVRSWDDAAAQPDRRRLVDVERWTRPDDETVKGSEGPNKRPWLGRVDGRITAGWAAHDTIGFAWTSGKIAPSDSTASYKFPHIRVAILDRAKLNEDGSSTLKPIAQPHLWSGNFAMAYPAAAPNTAGDIGLALFFGGPKHYPSSAVGVLRKENADWRSMLTLLSTGSNTPRCLRTEGVDDTCGVWGDYLGVRPDPNVKNGWYVAAHIATDKYTGKGQKAESPKVEIVFAPFRARDADNLPSAAIVNAASPGKSQ
ncbi:hypothetical protein ACETIH_28555 [Microvirga arabica]|uniref:DUF946 domain-containing protein n=1 Tax=Microvirga arabica TaxID=1128671 RepID=A0ABV6YH31_9HYPH